MNTTIVSSDWLNNNLDNPNLIILDASQLSSEEKIIQIFGARVFDIKNDFSDNSSSFPNTFPSKEQFEKGCQKLGIHSTSKIVVYDNKGIYTSPRVWWMFSVMGHKDVSVLDGGLPEWVSQGFQVEKNVKKKYPKGDFKASIRPGLIRNFDFVLENLRQKKSLVIDARSVDRFNSLVPEPRANLRSGNIPNSINIPFQNVLENGKFKSVQNLKTLFDEKKIAKKQLIFSCGSGITACIVLLATELVFRGNKSVYDGSWTEWAQLKN